MKILLTTDWWTQAVNGVVRSVTLLRRELQAQGHDVRVLTLSPTSHSYIQDDIYYLGSISAQRVYPGARLRVAAWSRCLTALAEWGPDIIHSQCEFSTFLPAWQLARRCHCPLVHTYHTVYEDYTHYIIPSEWCGRLAVREFSRLVLGRCDAVIAPTGKVGDILARYDLHIPVYTVPTGIDLGMFHPAEPGRRAELRRELGLPEDRTVLMSVGRLAAEKNHSQLLQLLAGQPAETRPLMVFVGDGPARGRLEQEAAALDLGASVRFEGMVPSDQVPSYYQAGDLFVSASQSETQGLTYFEALACGLPLLVRADPCLEGVVENGVNGWAWTNASTFGEDLARFRNRDEAGRKALRAGALATAGRFSAEHFGRQAMEVYQETLRRCGMPAAAGL